MKQINLTALLHHESNAIPNHGPSGPGPSTPDAVSSNAAAGNAAAGSPGRPEHADTDHAERQLFEDDCQYPETAASHPAMAAERHASRPRKQGAPDVSRSPMASRVQDGHEQCVQNETDCLSRQKYHCPTIDEPHHGRQGRHSARLELRREGI